MSTVQSVNSEYNISSVRKFSFQTAIPIILNINSHHCITFESVSRYTNLHKNFTP